MEEIPFDPSVTIKTPSVSNTIPIRINKATSRILKSFLIKCNRKSYGRRVRADDVLTKALSLLADTHIEEIQRSTYTSQDQLEIEFKKYCSKNGTISKDEFLKIILNRALSQNQEAT